MTKEELKDEIEKKIAEGESLLKCFENLQCLNPNDRPKRYDSTTKQKFANDLQEWEYYVEQILKTYFDNAYSDFLHKFIVSEPNHWYDFKSSGINILNKNITTLKSIQNCFHMLKIDNLQEDEREPSDTPKDRPYKVFISHATADKDFVECLVDLLEFIEIKNKENLFCSSIEGYEIPNSKDIRECLLEQFKKYRPYVIIVHSDNYYSSPYCMNEMGATWVLGTNFCSLLVKGFDFNKMRGVIGSNYTSIKVDAEDAKSRLNSLKDELISIFQLKEVDYSRWETKRDNFLKDVNAL